MTARPGATPRRLRVVFLGTSAFAVAMLRALLPRHEVVAAVTQPARPAGRGRRVRRSPIDRLAAERSLPVLRPKRLRKRAGWAPVAALEPECLVVADYGQILPARLLRVPPLGAVNVHASLLPALRGAAPAAWAVARRLPGTGVTTMLMDAGLDTGPVLLQRETAIGSSETGGELLARLAPIGAELLLETLDRLAAGAVRPRLQDEEAASWAPRITPADTALDWRLSAPDLEARVRGFAPAPGAFTALASPALGEPRRLRIHAATAGSATAGSEGDPGDGRLGACRVEGSRRNPRLRIGCAGGTALLPELVQAAGSRAMPIGAFLRGAPWLRGPAPVRCLGAAELIAPARSSP